MNNIQTFTGFHSIDLWEKDLTTQEFKDYIQKYEGKELIEFLSRAALFGTCCNLEFFFSDAYPALKKLPMDDLIPLFSIPGVKRKIEGNVEGIVYEIIQNIKDRSADELFKFIEFIKTNKLLYEKNVESILPLLERFSMDQLLIVLSYYEVNNFLLCHFNHYYTLLAAIKTKPQEEIIKIFSLKCELGYPFLESFSDNLIFHTLLLFDKSPAFFSFLKNATKRELFRIFSLKSVGEIPILLSFSKEAFLLALPAFKKLSSEQIKSVLIINLNFKEIKDSELEIFMRDLPYKYKELTNILDNSLIDYFKEKLLRFKDKEDKSPMFYLLEHCIRNDNASVLENFYENKELFIIYQNEFIENWNLKKQSLNLESESDRKANENLMTLMDEFSKATRNISAV